MTHSGRPARGGLALLALAGSALALLALPGPAGARVSTLSGKVAGDANATVTMRLVKRRRIPRAVRWVVFRKLDHACQDGGVRQLNVVLRRSRVERIGITNKFTFFELLSPRSGLAPPNDRNQLAVTGQMFRGGRWIGGTVDSTVRFKPVPPDRVNACVTEEKRHYSVRRAGAGR